MARNQIWLLLKWRSVKDMFNCNIPSLETSLPPPKKTHYVNKVLCHLHISLTAAVWPWKPTLWSSWSTVFVLMLIADYWVEHCWRLSNWQTHSVYLHSLPHCPWDTVVPKHSHFAVIPLKADCWVSARKETSQADLFQTVEHSTFLPIFPCSKPLK